MLKYMKISILTLFPDMFAGPFSSSIIKRAQEKNTVTLEYINIRDYSRDTYKSVDDHPYGGGTGMILRVDVVDRALQAVSRQTSDVRQRKILLDPQGTPYTQKIAKSLCTYDHLMLICGHYEGIDERVRSLVDEEISIGDYVVTGGEIPSMIIVDSVVRLLPGVLSKSDATIHESFENSLLEYPQYTRPDVYKGIKVPPILKSGDHAKINIWKKEMAQKRTREKRPDLVLTEKTDFL